MWRLFKHICMYFGIAVLFMGLKRDCIGWMMMVDGVGWFDGLVEWFHGRKRQIHQQCSCPISGQGVLICSEASIHSAHQHYFLTSHTPTAPHQCLGQVEKIEKGSFYFTPGWTLCSGHRIKLLTFLPQTTLRRFEKRDLQWSLKVTGESFK